jgi:hypothetical protein
MRTWAKKHHPPGTLIPVTMIVKPSLVTPGGRAFDGVTGLARAVRFQRVLACPADLIFKTGRLGSASAIAVSR